MQNKAAEEETKSEDRQQRTRTLSSSSTSSSGSSDSSSSHDGANDVMYRTNQNETPMVMDIAASHLPDPPEPEPYVKPVEEPPKPVEEDTPPKPATPLPRKPETPPKPAHSLNMVKFVAASKDGAKTSSVSEFNAISLATNDVASSEEKFEVIESGTVSIPIAPPSAPIVPSTAPTAPPPAPMMPTPVLPVKLKPKEEPKPSVPTEIDEAEMLRKKREKEVMEQVTHALFSPFVFVCP